MLVVWGGLQNYKMFTQIKETTKFKRHVTFKQSLGHVQKRWTAFSLDLYWATSNIHTVLFHRNFNLDQNAPGVVVYAGSAFLSCKYVFWHPRLLKVRYVELNPYWLPCTLLVNEHQGRNYDLISEGDAFFQTFTEGVIVLLHQLHVSSLTMCFYSPV